MIIVLDNDYYAKPSSTLLGYVGEQQSRRVKIENYYTENADLYSVIFEYEDGVKYEVDFHYGEFEVTASLLRSPQKVKCQILAKAVIQGTDAYRLVKKSNIFLLDIGKSIEGEPEPVPDYEETLSLLDKIRQMISGDISAGEIKHIITVVLADAIAADIKQGE